MSLFDSKDTNNVFYCKFNNKITQVIGFRGSNKLYKINVAGKMITITADDEVKIIKESILCDGPIRTSKIDEIVKREFGSYDMCRRSDFLKEFRKWHAVETEDKDFEKAKNIFYGALGMSLFIWIGALITVWG